MNYDCTLPHRRYFYKLTQIPHGSRNEKALSDYLVDFARVRGLECQQDEEYNVIIRKPASAGCEDAPTLCLQAHMDMVCEKNRDTVHDFLRDPLHLIVSDDGILRADGTTLGADDGTGVAYMLAILDSDALVHPALECIFTTQEEIGMFGAMALKKEDIHAHRMVSLDGGGENNTLLSSAGGCCVTVERAMSREANANACYCLNIGGLSGGHSGTEIHMEKGNANKLMARVLKTLMLSGIPVQLCSINGGMKDNAIPRECEAVIASAAPEETIRAIAKKASDEIGQELAFSDAGFYLRMDNAEIASEAFTEKDSVEAVNLLYLCPNGFIARSMAIEGLTMTSLNVGIVRTQENGLCVTISLRSMLESCIDQLYITICELARIFDARVSRSASYPGWNYREKSAMRDYMAAAVHALYGEDLNVTAAHGGTECGVFSALQPDMDIISIGPIARFIHTPDEELDLASFDRTYTLLTDVIRRCAEG